MSSGSGEPRAWAVRLLALPLQAALSVDRLGEPIVTALRGFACPVDLHGHQ